MFEKGKEYMVNLTENYFWISSEFYKGYELNENLLKYFTPKEKTDSIVEDVINQFRKRSKVGIEKYGTTLNDNNTDDFLTHAMEEAMDFTLYLQKIKELQKQNTTDKVLEWAINKNLIHAKNVFKQYWKLQEECNELYKAILDNNKDEIIDALGDIRVVITILAKQLDLDIDDCFDSAYNVIKNRTGVTINGEFKKD